MLVRVGTLTVASELETPITYLNEKNNAQQTRVPEGSEGKLKPASTETEALHQQQRLVTYDRLRITMSETQLLYYNATTNRKGSLLNSNMSIGVQLDRCLARSAVDAGKCQFILSFTS